MITFEEMGLAPGILKGIAELGFEKPMPVQEKVIPALLKSKRDLIGLAQTGTGKTAAFGLPIIHQINPDDIRIQSLILAPTRELCLQIATDLKNFSKYIPNLHVVAVYGGADISRQLKALKKAAQIVVATPGRMNDLLNKRKKIDLSVTHTVVLDEADEMLNMGFKEELDAILERTPEQKNTLLFSATMSAEVQRISKNYMDNPQEITIGVRNAGGENVEHIQYIVRSKDRYPALKRIVDFYPNIYSIVFCRTRAETKDIAEKLIEDGYSADALHGDLSQTQREYIMHKFRNKNLQILVATDVAARGLDVKDITHVIQYSLPGENDIYIHRSGRTGRAGQKGTSIAIVNLKEKHKIKAIESKLKKKFELRTVPGGKEICEKQLFSHIDKLQKIEVDHKEVDKFLPTVCDKLEWMSREELIKHFVSLEFNRLLQYYKDARDLNAPDEPVDRQRRRTKGDSFQRSDKQGTEDGYTRFHINLGYKDSLTPRDLIGMVKRCTRKRNIEIGKIDLMKTFSFFEVDNACTDNILAGFKGIEYNFKEVSVKLSQTSTRPMRPPRQKKKKYHR